jgi:nucleoid-associated protein YgaU
VVAGDTLSGIAQRSYGYASLYTLIAEVNNIADPHTVNPGQVLILPSM